MWMRWGIVGLTCMTACGGDEVPAGDDSGSTSDGDSTESATADDATDSSTETTESEGGPVDSGESTESSASSSSGSSTEDTGSTESSESGSSSEGTTDPESTSTGDDGCGDGNVSPGEQCDGDDLQDFDCEALGYGGGELACDPVTCMFDERGCDDGGDEPCGNGMIDIGEQCDGGDLAGLECADFGLDDGLLLCDPTTCTYDTSLCGIFACGDGDVDAGEQCDGAALQGFTCVLLGFDAGTLTCDPMTCTFDTSDCDA